MRKRPILFPLLFIGYSVTSIVLFLYSFTQVDLNLTLSRASIWQDLQQVFIQIGYYDRPFSAFLYIIILTALFVLYCIVIKKAAAGLVTIKQIWTLIILVAALLVLSYPSFSYDVFNYMFTAKTVLVYQKNPYEVIPLQFAGFDPYLSFMRWTHLPSAYGPVWIALTLPFYLFGFGYFLLTLWSFKVLMAGFYILAALGVGKILKEFRKDDVSTGVAVFALNPLILIESLVSSHNDIAMMAVAIWGIYYLLKKRYYLAIVLLSLSVALKLMTIILLPILFVVIVKNRMSKNSLGYENIILYSTISLILALIMVITRREILPWYLVWIIPFVALLPRRIGLIILTIGASVGHLLRYVPYLYYGNYEVPTVIAKFWMTVIPVGLSVLLSLFFYRKKLHR